MLPPSVDDVGDTIGGTGRCAVFTRGFGMGCEVILAWTTRKGATGTSLVECKSQEGGGGGRVSKWSKKK